MPNGVFQVRRDGRAEVVTSAQWRPAPDIRLATQSGPMLVIDGKLHPAFDHDGSSRHIRNGVGIAPDGRALFVISDGPVSLGKFARFFRDALKCRNALFFDGAVSALWDPASYRRDVTEPLGPLVVAFTPAESSAWSRRPRQTLSACTVSGTSWTRTICAPCSTALSAKASDSAEALVGRRLVRQGADGALAAGAEDDRAAEQMEQREAVHQLEIVGDRLAEAETRVDEDARALDARTLSGGDPLLEP